MKAIFVILHLQESNAKWAEKQTIWHLLGFDRKLAHAISRNVLLQIIH